ncbi:MAG: ASCH domain-containing protein [Ketobacter sp.]|nr:ASCH domain-containing protein [Ketobacter sp.]
MKILHLTLKRKWFDLIASGEKRYEYREDKQYWRTRLLCECGNFRKFDIIRFRNGYSKDARQIDVEFIGGAFTNSNTWNPQHGEEFTGKIIVLELGQVLA